MGCTMTLIGLTIESISATVFKTINGILTCKIMPMCCGKNITPHPYRQEIFNGLILCELVWILCNWKVLLQTYRHSYTVQRCVITMGKKQIRAKIDPTSFQAGFLRNCELRLGTLSWIVSQLDCK